MNSVAIMHVVISANDKVNFRSGNGNCCVLFKTGAYRVFDFLNNDNLVVLPFEKVADLGFVVI